MLWECTLCHYVHKDDVPPDICPLCENDSTYFTKVEEEVSGRPILSGMNQILAPLDPETSAVKAIHSLTYGLFVVTSFDVDDEGNYLRDNGQTANACFQVTSEPVQIVVALNKNNLTHECVRKSGKIGLSVLHQHQQGHILADRFGYCSGRDSDKFEGVAVHRGRSGVLLMSEALTTLEASVAQSFDVGTHTLFVAEVTAGEMLFEGTPMTYAYFRATR